MVEKSTLKRVDALRAWMKKEKLDAYLVPHADRFQSEYMPASAERLAWLTGFTGSAGLAAVLAQKAYLFTDGRYTLQAPQQVDVTLFDIVQAPPKRPIDSLVQDLDHGAIIGFDPWLFTVTQMRQWKAASKDHAWVFQAVLENPIDAAWHDRPVDPVHKGFVHALRYAGQSREEKIKAVLAARSDAAGAVLISDPTLVCWLLNIRGHDVPHVPVLMSMALVRDDHTVVLMTDISKVDNAMRDDLGKAITIRPLDALFDVLREQKKPIQIDPAQCPVAVYEYCQEQNMTVLEFADPCVLLRACKNEAEINGAQKAHDKDAAAFEKFIAWFHAQDFKAQTITEKDIAAQLHAFRAEDTGFVEDSFNTISGFAGNGAIVHYAVDDASNATLKPNGLLLLDSGGQYPYGSTDITRCFAVGMPTQEMKKHYTAVLKGLIALSEVRFPKGTSGAQLEMLARQPLWDMGLNFAHGTGHGVGAFMSVHEGPQGFSPRGVAPLREGMILSIEPGVYFEGAYGIRLENLVVVVADPRAGDVEDMLALRTLTSVPFESALIDWDALSAHEVAWLKTFKTTAE